MNNYKNLILTALIAIIASLATLQFAGNKSASPTAQTESTYDRVMRTGVLRCGYFSWPPFASKDAKTGEVQGFMVDLINQAFSTMDLTVEWKEVVLGTQLQDLKNDRIDALCGDGPYVMSAGKFVEFSSPLFATSATVYARQDEQRFKSYAALNSPDVRFTGIDGDFSSDLVKRLFPKAQSLSMPSTTDPSELFLNVATGKADLAIVDPMTFSKFDKSSPGKLKPLFTDQAIGTYKLVISVGKGDLKTLGLVNQAIDNSHAFGITKKVLDTFDPEHKFLRRVKSVYAE